MNKYEDVLGRMNEDEKKAFGILEKNGWIPFVNVSVEKAIISGMRFETFSVGGHYDMGFLKAEMPLPKTKAKKTGKRG